MNLSFCPKIIPDSCDLRTKNTIGKFFFKQDGNGWEPFGFLHQKGSVLNGSMRTEQKAKQGTNFY